MQTVLKNSWVGLAQSEPGLCQAMPWNIILNDHQILPKHRIPSVGDFLGYRVLAPAFRRKSTVTNRRKRVSTKACRKFVLFPQRSHQTSGNLGIYGSMRARAKTPLTQFDRKGEHIMRTPMHARCIPDACPDAYPDAAITST